MFALSCGEQLKRNTSNVLRKATEARQTKVSQINLNLNVLLRQAKDIDRELHLRRLELGIGSDGESGSGGGGGGGGLSSASGELEVLKRKQRVLSASISAKTHEIDAVETRAAALKALVCETSQTSICRLMVLSRGATRTRRLASPSCCPVPRCCPVPDHSPAVPSRGCGCVQVELETGGNIRLEDGKPTDVWHSSCVDLVTSRFLAAE